MREYKQPLRACYCLFFLLLCSAPGWGEEPRRLITAEFTLFETTDQNSLLTDEKLDRNGLLAVIQNATNSNELKHLTRVRTTSVEGLRSVVQIGAKERVGSGMTMTPGGAQKVYTIEDVGTIVSFIPRVFEDQINFQLEFEQTRLERNEDVEELQSPRTVSLTLSTSCSIRSGQVKLISASEQLSDGDHQRFTYLLLEAHIVD
ncbi:hypothetical protein AB1L42_16500 [Thalassoglobus sp. JC818]|uniref:hypothetical protein n=1 Tax=Thalassoglobus sp. JC818 TaxID=3232136 RepID=UPI003459C723